MFFNYFQSMDQISFESMEVLKNQPVSRVPSFHIMFALYKGYEGQIENGCKVITVSKNFASFIVNPSLDLSGTEKRMKLFNDYWLSDWDGIYGKPPLKADFESILKNKDLLL